jgi:hypothetical protein
MHARGWYESGISDSPYREVEEVKGGETGGRKRRKTKIKDRKDTRYRKPKKVAKKARKKVCYEGRHFTEATPLCPQKLALASPTCGGFFLERKRQRLRPVAPPVDAVARGTGSRRCNHRQGSRRLLGVSCLNRSLFGT